MAVAALRIRSLLGWACEPANLEGIGCQGSSTGGTGVRIGVQGALARFGAFPAAKCLPGRTSASSLLERSPSPRRGQPALERIKRGIQRKVPESSLEEELFCPTRACKLRRDRHFQG